MQLLLSTSQTSVEQKLDKLISDFQQGKRAPSVVSLQTVDSLDPDDKEAWRTIRKELEDIGISVAAFDANKDFIFEWFSNAVDTGAFQEQAVSSPSRSVYSLDVLSSTSSLMSAGVRELNKTVTGNTEPPKASKATSKPTGNHTTVKARQASNEIGAAAEPQSSVIPTKVPRVAALIATLSRPKKGLINAVIKDDMDSIKKILTNPATSRLIDRPALNAALQSASRATSREAYVLLVDSGADINDGHSSSRPLTRAVMNGKKDLVALLLDKGADVNYQDGDGLEYSSALRAAITDSNTAMITLLVRRGADINAVQKVSHIFWRERLYPTGIHQASAESSASVVDRLINLGAILTYSQSGFGTPLMLAIYNGRLATTELLIKRRANINEVPGSLGFRNFRSTIHIAIYRSSPVLVKLLLNNGVVTDWHEAYELAEQRTTHLYPLYQSPSHGKISDDRAVLELIKEKLEQELAEGV